MKIIEKSAQPYGIMFHHFREECEKNGPGAITADQFASILEHVGIENIIPAWEWHARMKAGKVNPGEVCLTFDDALHCQYDIALPVMESYSLTAYWFVYSSVLLGGIETLEIYRHFRTHFFESEEHFCEAFFKVVDSSPYREEVASELNGFEAENYLWEFPFYTNAERKFRFIRDMILGHVRYNGLMHSMLKESKLDEVELTRKLWLDSEHLRDLDTKGHVIGLHSFSHPTKLSSLTVERQREEYSKNFTHLKDVLGKSPTSMSHPCNSYDSDTLQILRELGIEIGFCANMHGQGETLFEIPREDHMNILKTIS